MYQAAAIVAGLCNMLTGPNVLARNECFSMFYRHPDNHIGKTIRYFVLFMPKEHSE